MVSTSGVFSTSGGYHEYIGGGDIMSKFERYLVHRGDIKMNVGDTMSTSGDVQYIGGISSMSTMINVQYMYHDILHCTEHAPMYS